MNESMLCGVKDCMNLARTRLTRKPVTHSLIRLLAHSYTRSPGMDIFDFDCGPRIRGGLVRGLAGGDGFL